MTLKNIRQLSLSPSKTVPWWAVLAPGPGNLRTIDRAAICWRPITCQALCEVLSMHYLIGFSQKSQEEKIMTCALCCGYCGLHLCKATQHIRADPTCTSLPSLLYSTVCKNGDGFCYFSKFSGAIGARFSYSFTKKRGNEYLNSSWKILWKVPGRWTKSNAAFKPVYLEADFTTIGP